jgi:O-antigen ligase
MEYAVPARESRHAFLRGVGILVGAGLLTAFATELALLLYSHPPSVLVLLGFTVVLLGALALAVFSFEAALVVGVLLMAAVRVEPAPTDVVFAVLMAVALATNRFRLRRVLPWAVLLVGAFIGFNLLSTIDAANPGRAVGFLGITIYVAVLGLWLASHVTSSPVARRLARAYVGVAVVSAVLSTLALFVPFPGHHLLTRIGRAEGLFKDPNVFGPFLVPAALIVFEEIVTPRLFLGRRWTKVLAFFALTLGVVFSYSRAAWLNLVLGVVVVLVILAFRRGGGRRAAQALAVVVVAIGAVSAAVAFTGSLSFLEQRAKVQNYDSGRFGAQSESIAWATRHPFGIGPGQFEKRAHIAAHSMYARALAEEGIPGFVALLVLLLATLAWAARNAVLGRDTYGIGSAALLGAWCGILANGAFVDTLHWRHLWVVAGLIWAAASRPS